MLSLFDGISCGRVALSRLGITPSQYYASELDTYAIKVAQRNWPDNIQLGDVTKWREWGINWWDIDLLIGGSPCQGFSFAGKQLAFDDPRSALFFEFVNIRNHINIMRKIAGKPPVKFLLENVRMKNEHLDVISNYLGIGWVFINSKLVSAQSRPRYYWCNWYIPQPTDKGINLVDILEPIVDIKYFHSDAAVEFMNGTGGTGRVKWSYGFHSDVRNGKSACLLANLYKGAPGNVLVCGREVGRRINPLTGRRDDYNTDIKPKQRFEARYDKKSGTLTTVQKDNVLGIEGIPVSVRKFTPTECERLQTLNDDYTNGVSNTQRYIMIGNAWNVDTIVHILKGANL